jgi:hypothetical protein
VNTRTRARDARIDIIRGAAMLTIVINHLTWAFQNYGFAGAEVMTPTSLGYSSSAALFVTMSGYMVGMVYLKKPKPANAVLKRALQLYIYNALLFACVVPIIFLMSEIEGAKWGANLIVRDANIGVLEFLGLVKAPVLLDVLQLYIIFMICTPAAFWLYRKSATALAGVSIMLWTLSQLATASHYIDPQSVQWGFNPAAWQILFFVPLILGARREHENLFHLLERHKWVTVGIAVIAVIFAIAKLNHIEEGVRGMRILTSKGNLGALRLFHAVIVLVLYCGLLSLSERIPKLPPMRALACLGRQTLKCYVLSVWLTYSLTVAWDRMNGGDEVYYYSLAFAVFVTFAAAAILDAGALKRPKPSLIPAES